MNRIFRDLLCAVVTLACVTGGALAQTKTYSFGVLPQRNALLAAKYWNPILDYVGKRSGVTLEFVTKKSSLEYSEAEAQGEFDFTYNNHIFSPSHAAVAYVVIARPAGPSIHSQIVVTETSKVRSLRDLVGLPVGFPNKNGFTGYAAPMSALIQAGVTVKPEFGGNQEGVMAQLRSGVIAAAGVNSRVMEEYAAREKFAYRAIWTSEPYLDLPIAAHPRVPSHVAQAVRAALIGMAKDPEGQRILNASAIVIGRDIDVLGFVPAQDAGYRNQRDVYRLIWQQEGRR